MPSANVKIILSNIRASDYGGDVVTSMATVTAAACPSRTCALLLGKKDAKDFPVNETRVHRYVIRRRADVLNNLDRAIHVT